VAQRMMIPKTPRKNLEIQKTQISQKLLKKFKSIKKIIKIPRIFQIQNFLRTLISGMLMGMISHPNSEIKLTVDLVIQYQ
jgi:hypothetical protein